MFHIWWYHHVARQPYNGKLKWLFNSRAGLGLGYCCTAITEKRISHRDQNSFLQQAVNVFISAVKLDCLLITESVGLTFGARLKWPLVELQSTTLLCWVCFFSSDGYCLHHKIKVIETCGEICFRSAKDFPLGFIYVLRLVLNLHRSLIKAYVRTTKGSGVWFRRQMQGDSSCCTFSSTGLHLCRLKLLGVLILVVFSTFFTWRHGSVCDRARMRSAKRVLSFRQLVTVITN